jgi:hypothetical protein
MKNKLIVSAALVAALLVSVALLWSCGISTVTEKAEADISVPYGWGKVSFPLPGGGGRALTKAQQQSLTNFYQVIFHKRATDGNSSTDWDVRDNYITGSASAEQGYLTVAVPPGQYEILLLAGRKENGQNVLLGSAFVNNETGTDTGIPTDTPAYPGNGITIKRGTNIIPLKVTPISEKTLSNIDEPYTSTPLSSETAYNWFDLFNGNPSSPSTIENDTLGRYNYSFDTKGIRYIGPVKKSINPVNTQNNTLTVTVNLSNGFAPLKSANRNGTPNDVTVVKNEAILKFIPKSGDVGFDPIKIPPSNTTYESNLTTRGSPVYKFEYDNNARRLPTVDSDGVLYWEMEYYAFGNTLLQASNVGLLDYHWFIRNGLTNDYERKIEKGQYSPGGAIVVAIGGGSTVDIPLWQ